MMIFCGFCGGKNNLNNPKTAQLKSTDKELSKDVEYLSLYLVCCQLRLVSALNQQDGHMLLGRSAAAVESDGCTGASRYLNRKKAPIHQHSTTDLMDCSRKNMPVLPLT